MFADTHISSLGYLGFYWRTRELISTKYHFFRFDERGTENGDPALNIQVTTGVVSTVQPGIMDPHESIINELFTDSLNCDSFKGLTLEDVVFVQGNDDFSELLAESVDNEPFDGWFTSEDVPFHHQRDDAS